MKGDFKVEREMTHKTELLPCPFCGGLELTLECAPDERRMNEATLEAPWIYGVFCASNNGMCGTGPSAGDDTEARTLWNRRAALQPQDSATKGETFYRDAYEHSAKAYESLVAENAEQQAEIERLTSDRDAKSKRMWELGKECDEKEAEIERLRKALNGVVNAYAAYRGKGVMPAPDQYRLLVEAIQAAALAARSQP
jgi:hypothetical protein